MPNFILCQLSQSIDNPEIQEVKHDLSLQGQNDFKWSARVLPKTHSNDGFILDISQFQNELRCNENELIELLKSIPPKEECKQEKYNSHEKSHISKVIANIKELYNNPEIYFIQVHTPQISYIS